MNKRFRNYYTRLAALVLIAVFLMVFTGAAVMIGFLYSSQMREKTQQCEEAMQELRDTYKEIYEEYFTAFLPLNYSYYQEDLSVFLEMRDTGYNKYVSESALIRVLSEVCQKQSQIEGVVLRRTMDNAKYWYSEKTAKLSPFSQTIGNETISQKYTRVLVGARLLNVTLSNGEKQSAKVFGFQSGVVTPKEEDGDVGYQITVLYDTKVFDKILKNYDLDPDARFLITSFQGKVIYDNKGEYANNQDTLFPQMDQITSESNTITMDQIDYNKRVGYLLNGDYMVFYLIPQSALNKLHLDGAVTTVILGSGLILALTTMIMLLLNRLSARKFFEIEEGMHQIENNCLEYRIPVGKSEDEFSRIAVCFNRMCDNLEEMIDKNYVYQMLQQNAKYQALQTSVNPHFLYNALEAIREKLAASDHYDEAEMILLLSRIFEYQIRGESQVTMQKELESLQNYMDFSSIRYQYVFDYSVEMDDEIMGYIVPKLIFQPVAENFFAHGFRGDGSDCLEIRGWLDKEDDMVHISFCDNGKGITSERAKMLNASMEQKDNSNSHIGLGNVHERLRIAFGGASRVEVLSNEPKPGATIILIFEKQIKLMEVSE